MASLTELQTRIDSAIAAMDSGNWPDVLRHARAARLMLIALPDSQFDGDEMTFDRQTVAATLSSLERAAAAEQVKQRGQIIAKPIEYMRG